MDPEQSASLDLVRELSALGHAIGRRVGVLIDRNGAVRRVLVGAGSNLDVPRLDREKKAAGRLSGLRWIATAALGQDEPTRRDLDAIVRWRLDLLLLVVPGEDGAPAALREAWLVPAQADGSQGVHVAPLMPPHLVREDLPEHLEEVERVFEEATPATQATGAGAARPALLAAVTTGRRAELEADLAELRELCRSAGLDPKGELTQRRDAPDHRTFIGSGRVADLTSLALTTGAQVVVFNEELAPRQLVNLEDALGIDVLDRTQLILHLFAQRARTHAGKLQVEAARLRYEKPRLLGRGEEMSRIGGRGGGGGGRTRGAGEKKLEIDRRTIDARIDAIDRELAQLRKQRAMRRQRRQKNRLPHVAIVGYTNVGKSTLFNRLTDSEVVAEDLMFATLDPTLRQRRLPSGRRVVFSDTVGFIRRLPDELVRAFGATLDELAQADVLLHVADASDPEVFDRISTVREVVEGLGHDHGPELLAFNKADRLEDPALFLPLACTVSSAPLLISAETGAELDALLERVEGLLGPRPSELVASEDLVSEPDLEAYEGEGA